MKKTLSKQLSWLVPTVAAVAFAVLAWWRLVVENSDYLYEAHDQSFWQPGGQYWREMLQRPGGAFSWAGQFLTQFFHVPAVGASMLIALWLSIYGLTLAAWRLRWQWCWVALAVPVVLLWSVTSLGYAIYVSKVPDWCFTPTLFVLFISVLMLVGRWFPTKIRVVWSVAMLIGLVACGQRFMSDAEVPRPGRMPMHGALSDANFHAEIRMARAAEAADWNGVLAEMRRTKEPPTRLMWMLKNIALLNEGRLLEDWLNYGVETQLPAFNDSVSVPMVESHGSLVYFLHGSIQFCYRWNMENMVEYGPSVQRLRLMTRCAIVRREWDLAEKYINLLSRTLFWREWAESQRRLLHHPELLADAPDYRLAVRLSEPQNDILDGDDGKLELYLINALSHVKPHRCPELATMSLMLAMQSQVISNFWNQFYLYVHVVPRTEMPRSVQEAAYLYKCLEPQTAPQAELPFAPAVTQSYQQFQQRSRQLMARGYRDEALAKAMRREFGQSFYWFYFFCRDVKTY